jgi:hypothetical protein
MDVDDRGKVKGGLVSWKKVTHQYLTRGTVSSGVSAYIDGWFGMNDFNLLPAILRSGTITTRTEKGPSGELLVLEGVSPWGKHTVWMDPRRGHVPVKMVQRKGPNDWHKKDQPLGNYRTREYGGTYYKDNEVTATATRIEVRDGKHVVTGYTVIEKDEFRNGKTWVSTYTGTISDLDLSPKLTDADFSLAMRAPDGAPVYMQDEPQIRYEMQDGQPVKSIDQDVVRSVEGHFFARSSPLTRAAIAAGIVSGVALAVYAVMWLRRRRTV